MTIAAIRKQLHEFIEIADEKKLKAIHLLLEDNMRDSSYSKEDLKKFYDRLHEYESGTMKVFPMAKVHNEIRERIAGK